MKRFNLMIFALLINNYVIYANVWKITLKSWEIYLILFLLEGPLFVMSMFGRPWYYCTACIGCWRHVSFMISFICERARLQLSSNIIIYALRQDRKQWWLFITPSLVFQTVVFCSSECILNNIDKLRWIHIKIHKNSDIKRCVGQKLNLFSFVLFF